MWTCSVLGQLSSSFLRETIFFPNLAQNQMAPFSAGAPRIFVALRTSLASTPPFSIPLLFFLLTGMILNAVKVLGQHFERHCQMAESIGRQKQTGLRVFSQFIQSYDDASFTKIEEGARAVAVTCGAFVGTFHHLHCPGFR